MVKTQSPADLNGAEAEGLPPFGMLAKSPCIALGLIGGILVGFGRFWLFGGAAAGLLVSLGTFYSIHIIVRLVTMSFVADRKSQANFKVKENQTRAMWKLGWYLIADVVFLGILMTAIYAVSKNHLIPFMLAFVAQFAISQILIVMAASKYMRTLH